MIFFDLLILALVFITLSKEKNENEVISQKRMQLFISSFIAGFAFVMIKPLIDLLFRDSTSQVNGQQLIFFVLSIHTINFYIYKINVNLKGSN